MRAWGEEDVPARASASGAAPGEGRGGAPDDGDGTALGHPRQHQEVREIGRITMADIFETARPPMTRPLTRRRESESRRRSAQRQRGRGEEEERGGQVRGHQGPCLARIVGLQT